MNHMLQLERLPPCDTGLEHGPWPDDCHACNRPGNYRERRFEGVACLLTVEDGTASVHCAACGAEMWPDGDPDEYQMEQPVPVTLAWRGLCFSRVRGSHWDGPCDCGAVLDITPVPTGGGGADG
jgi:hypothetical protein